MEFDDKALHIATHADGWQVHEARQSMSIAQTMPVIHIGLVQFKVLTVWCCVHADDEPSCSTERPMASLRAAGPEKALDALLLAAPNKGEVQPWVWLLGAVAQRCSINSVHTGVSYLVRCFPARS